MIFGLSMALLFNAIAQVESDRGATSQNVYQLRNIYIDDINRIYNLQLSYDIKYRKDLSEKAMRLYWLYYGERYTKLTGKPVAYEVLARIHNGGPDGFKKYATKRYWRAVKRHLPNE
jgi:hypothetical protein